MPLSTPANSKISAMPSKTERTWSSASSLREPWCPLHQTILRACQHCWFSRGQDSFSGYHSHCREARRKLHFLHLISGTFWIRKVHGCWVWTTARLTITSKNGRHLDHAFSGFNTLLSSYTSLQITKHWKTFQLCLQNRRASKTGQDSCTDLEHSLVRRESHPFLKGHLSMNSLLNVPL